MAEKNKKSKVGKIVTGIIAGVSVIVAGVIVATKVIPSLNGGKGSDGPDTVLRLDAPSNVSFDSNTYTLSWNDVAHADGYNIDINGKVVQSGTNEYHYVPTSKTTTFKVQATDSTNEYTASNWSTDYSYTIPQGQVSLAALNTFVSGMLQSSTLDKVICMHAEGDKLYTTARFTNGNVYEFMNKYPSEITSFKNIVSGRDYGISQSIRNSYQAKDYDSVSYYLQSDTYKGALEDYRQQGYTFEVVTSQAYRIDQNMMGFASTFKLTNSENVKYVSNRLECYISDTANESVKYTSSLVNIDENSVRLRSCTELTGDFVDYAKVMENANQHTTNTTVQSAYTYDGGMSY